jgi:hypothetical protein
MEDDFPPFPFRGKVRALPAATIPMKPIYGALHPLEGGRPYHYDEEAIALTVALESLNNFWEQYRKRLNSNFNKLSGTYTVYAPSLDSDVEEAIKVVVKTMPDLANELHQLVEEDDEDDDDSPLINEDLWPDNALIHMMTIPWEQVDFLRNADIHHQFSDSITAIAPNKKGEGLAGLMIQTSRPKALELIEQINSFDGIQSLCFNPAEDIFGNICHLGLMVMGNDDLHLFGEFDKSTLNGEHHKRWKQRAKNTKGNICVIIAMGITGASRGNPAPHHILGYYEIKLIDDKELGLGKLRAEPTFDFEF